MNRAGNLKILSGMLAHQILRLELGNLFKTWNGCLSLLLDFHEEAVNLKKTYLIVMKLNFDWNINFRPSNWNVTCKSTLARTVYFTSFYSLAWGWKPLINLLPISLRCFYRKFDQNAFTSFVYWFQNKQWYISRVELKCHWMKLKIFICIQLAKPRILHHC